MFGSIKSLQAERENSSMANTVNWICAGLSFISTKLKIIHEKACNDFECRVSWLSVRGITDGKFHEGII
jgi:leucyl-tRNA synthetase